MLPGEQGGHTSIFIIKECHILGGRCCAPQWHGQKHSLLGMTLGFIRRVFPGQGWNGAGFYTTIQKMQLGDRDGRTPVPPPVPRDPRADCGILQIAQKGDL